MATKQRRPPTSQQSQSVETNASLETILKDLEGLQQLHHFQSTLIREAIKQVKQLDGK
ncbi:MAG: hypothetical protein KDA93_27395 [Planctomycetaceae bacterium]|nr:hypothetical protein [Planctomycetaceae bacterium]